MILLQILAGIVLLPLTILMLLIFNLCLIQRIYLFFVASYVLVYASLFGFVFYDVGVAGWVFGLMSAFYVIRMCLLTRRLSNEKDRRNPRKYPVIQGNINIKSKKQKCRASFLFPLSFLGILKWLPKAASQELKKKTRLDMDISQLVDCIMIYSLGTHVEVISEDADIYLEIN